MAGGLTTGFRAMFIGAAIDQDRGRAGPAGAPQAGLAGRKSAPATSAPFSRRSTAASRAATREARREGQRGRVVEVVAAQPLAQGHLRLAHLQAEQRRAARLAPDGSPRAGVSSPR